MDDGRMDDGCLRDDSSSAVQYHKAELKKHSVSSNIVKKLSDGADILQQHTYNLQPLLQKIPLRLYLFEFSKYSSKMPFQRPHTMKNTLHCPGILEKKLLIGSLQNRCNF